MPCDADQTTVTVQETSGGGVADIHSGAIAERTQQPHAGADDTRSSIVGPREDGGGSANEPRRGWGAREKESGRAGRRSGTGRCAREGIDPGGGGREETPPR